MNGVASQNTTERPVIRGRKHAISSGHFLASQAGYEILQAGGNAVDAGVAAAMVLAVVHSDIVNFAGVCPMMVYTAEDGVVRSIDGLGYWPRAADVEVFRNDFDNRIPEGILRTVMPAAPAAWIAALERFGTVSFADAVSFAAGYARDGFVLYPLMASNIALDAEKYRRWPSSAAHYLPSGSAPVVGEVFRQPDLASTIDYMIASEAAASHGGRQAGLKAARDAFYRGDIARTIADYHTAQGGWVTFEDLSGYKPAWEPVFSQSFRNHEVYSCGPWCQGPVLLQALKLLSRTGIEGLAHNSFEYIHLLAEVLKLSFCDREHFYGDPRFVDVPLETLLSDDYADRRLALIDRDKAWTDLPPRDPALTGTNQARLVEASEGETPPAHDTSFVAVFDRYGNAFSATPSDVSRDTPIIPGTGICPSSRGSQSRVEPGHPSVVAPGKRPRLTPNPAMVLDTMGRPVLALGSPGADVQSQAMLQALLNCMLFGMNPQEAVEAPRFATFSFPSSFAPHSHFPGRLSYEARIEPNVVEKLGVAGHDLFAWPSSVWRAGGVCLVAKDHETGVVSAGADPRRESYALGT